MMALSVNTPQWGVKSVQLIFLIMTFIFLTPIHASESIPQKLSADSLYRRGRQYIKQGDINNSIICLQLVADRYNPECTVKEGKLAIDANFLLFEIYSHYLFDSAKAYEVILRANHIAADKGIDNPWILFNLASIMQTLSQQTEDKELAKKSLDWYKICINRTLEKGHDKILNLAMVNYLLLSRDINIHELPDRKIWNAYIKYTEKSPGLITTYNRLLYNIITNERGQNYSEALQNAIKQLDLIKNDSSLIRFRLVSNLIIYDILREQNAPCADIEAQLDTLLRLSENFKHKDAQLMVYKLMWETYGDGDCTDYPKATLYGKKYLGLKASLLNFQQLSSIKGVEMSQEIKDAKDKMIEAEYRSQLHLVALWLSLVLCGAVTVFLIIIRNRNRHLSESNKKLYARTIELLHQDELRMTNKHEDMKKADEICRKKYASSLLTQEDKEGIMERIKLALSTEEEVYTPNFTLARLSELIGTPQRDISQVVNEMTSDNFISLLNEYRIKEACRRFKNPDYRMMTFEALANSVGFKARSSFIAAFKKYTGLTPSQYKKLSEAYDE